MALAGRNPPCVATGRNRSATPLAPVNPTRKAGSVSPMAQHHEDPTDLTAELATVMAIDSPMERARAVGARIDGHNAAIGELSRVRREALDRLLSQGLTQTAIAQALGMTRARVGQLLSSGPRPERAFLGAGALTVALAGKLEAGKEKPGPVVSAEAFAAYERLAELARTLGLATEYEVIPPPGIVTLNRTNLIVMCGPRLSPLVAQVLESDHSISFDKDDAGWHLIDRITGTVYRSPFDHGDLSDYAYIGRLPRPDGRGTFLYMAGIHAVGSSGAAHFLESNLADLHKEVKNRRFSMIVRCNFDEAHRVTASERVSPIYRHEVP